MNTKRHGTAQRTLVLAVYLFGFQGGLQLVCPAKAAAQTADEIIAKILVARGGLEKAKAVQAERITGTIYFNAEFYGPFLAEFKRPGKMHNEVTIQNKTVVRSFNGKDAGWVSNPFVGKDAPEPMSAEEVKDAVNEADFDGPLVDAKAKGNVIALGGTEKVEGRDAGYIHLSYTDTNGKRKNDSCALGGGAFSFSGQIKEPTMAYIFLDRENSAEVFLEQSVSRGISGGCALGCSSRQDRFSWDPQTVR